MIAVWDDLSAWQQDLAVAVALVLPVLVIFLLLFRGFAPWPLIWGLLRRYLWANIAFVLLIAVAVGMGLGLVSQERGLRTGMAKAADKFDLVIAPPGSELTMMLAAVYLRPTDAGLLDGAVYTEIATHPRVEIAAPLAFGDSVGDSPVVGSTASFVDYLSDRQIEGRGFTALYEAVIGAAVPLEIGDVVTPAHGVGAAAQTGVHEGDLTIVGRMAPTGSPWDKAIITAVESVWDVHGLATGHAPGANHLGDPFDAEYFPGTPAIIVRADGLSATYSLRSEFTRDAETMAFFPGAVLATLYRVMGDIRQAMSVMATVSQALVAASVLLSLAILTRLFRRQLAVLRAVGAPRRFIFAVIWGYASALLWAGATLGVGLGLIASAVLSRVISARTDVLITARLGWTELHLVLAFLLIAGVLSLWPAWRVLRGSTQDSLRN